MPNDPQMTAYCVEGQQAGIAPASCPYLHSSDAWLAWHAGFYAAGMSRVTKCRKSRGFSVKLETIGGNRVLFKATGDQLQHHTLTREG